MLRWAEEKELLWSEITWCKKYFQAKEGEWKARVLGISAGKDCYAARQAAMWETFSSRAAEAEVMMHALDL